MAYSRRRFIKTSALSATAVPLLLNADIDYCEAADASFDLSMGFPPGAIRLNFNENTLGPSPLAIEGAKQGIKEAYRYALGGLLKPLLAEHHQVDKEWILPGTGSTELQRLTPVAHLTAQGNVVSTLETWGGMLSVVRKMGAAVKQVPLLAEQGYRYDVEGLLAAVDADTRIFLMVTPNNPTGATLHYAQMKQIADALPKEVLFVLDEAYADYLPQGSKTGIDLIKEGYRNVLVTRTFSKAHALAGLRCGYGVGHPDILKPITHFGCGPASINMAVFGAVQGALQDKQHPLRSRDYVEKTRAYYQQQCQRLNLSTLSGVPPFMLIKLDGRVKEIQDQLRQKNIFVGAGESWNIPQFLRVSYGREAENRLFFRELTQLL